MLPTSRDLVFKVNIILYEVSIQHDTLYALGRKNYLFAGSTQGAKRTAMYYLFFSTCKKNNFNPFDWLRKVLEVIPMYKVNKLTELLPQSLVL